MKLIIPAILLFFAACSGADMNSQSASAEAELVDDVMTQEDQQALTADEILQDLQEGNERYVNNNLTPRDYSAQVSKTADGQYPEAVVISCIDSRVPVEHVFDKGVGDIFVARVAGNFVNEDILGSTEFATAVAGSKVILVMGHEHCGAVKSAIDDVQMGNITAMLSKIKPAVERTEEGYEGETTTENDSFVTDVVNNNVRYTIEQMRERSPIIAELERNGDVVIAGAFYDLDTGRVTMLD
ncbi:carbonic anhydrase family protein [Rhodohalobacter mucosus]|uniref:Carbonic anhydrase n=1 Tax=Rhodohalobacter mucosus TaxID=2079485 RepID=A0A316TNU7_9BACT|nr:carbonic anhydrase family protein [Rhodohalobacter mucosus]PWN06277.1 carbonic anhydrase [Rhodohalobacter mucosus]